jgi:hypothetical protein
MNILTKRVCMLLTSLCCSLAAADGNILGLPGSVNV